MLYFSENIYVLMFMGLCDFMVSGVGIMNVVLC